MAYTTIDDPGLYFNTVLYTSNNGSSPRTISGVGFQPDWVWVKNRDSSDFNHVAADSVRGLNTFSSPDTNSGELTNHAAGFISSANSDGFVITAGSSNLSNYDSGSNKQVAWCWKAGGSASSNSDGDITSSVSANQTAGFSIVTYTGTSTATDTVGHGLGAKPGWIVIKDRGGTNHWCVAYPDTLNNNQVLQLNLTNAIFNDSAGFNDTVNTGTTSSVFVSGNGGLTGSNSTNYVAYCFVEKQGYNKFSTYSGNGSTDGTFVYTGFKPAWILLKKTGSGNNWNIFDNKRNTFNVVTQAIAAQESGTGQNADFIDFLSNGFKLRSTDSDVNGSGSTYVYAAFAESPFVNSKGVPNNAR
jgi:cell wall assembly regulator SMI1